MPSITAGVLLTQILVGAAVSFALTVISRALAPDPKEDSANRAGWRGRIFQSRSPVAPRDIIYGELRKSGVVVYQEVTDGGKFLHTVIALGTGEVDSIPVVFLDDYPIYADDLDSDGVTNLNVLKYTGHVRIKKHLGSPGQSADPDLVSESDGHWTSSHRMAGISYIYIRLLFGQHVFTGEPAISVWIRGKVGDPRNTSPAQFSTNPASIFRDYMTKGIRDMGVGFGSGDIENTVLSATANVCDEFVKVHPITYTVSKTVGDVVFLTAAEKGFLLQTGDRVTFRGATRYVVFYKPFLSEANEEHGIKLATTYLNAVAGVAVALPSGSGSEVIKVAEPRYTASGVIDSSRTPRDNMADILSSMGGKAVYTQGKWKVRAAVYNPSILEYDESDIVSQISLQTKHSLRERFNAVKGQYISPVNLGVPAEYPQIKNSFYQNEDGGSRIFSVLDLPFTSRPHTAQRLAKIELEKHRQSIVFKASFKLSGLAVQPTDTIFLTLPRLGWDKKVFEIVEWEFVGKDDNNGVPVFTVSMTLQETASGVYDWNMGEETTTDLAPNTTFGLPLAPVTGITIEFEVVIGEDGTAYTSMKICWDKHPSPAVASYSVEYRKVGDTNWIPAGSVTATETPCIVVEPVEPGVAYEVRVRARSYAGLDSPYAYFTSGGVVGDRIAPGDPTNIALDPTPGGYFVTWVNPTDLDLDVIEIWEREHP